MFQILDYKCQYGRHSCLICFYLFYICGISLMYLDDFLFVSVCMMFFVSVILPYACPVLSIRLEYPELPLIFLIASYMFFISGVKQRKNENT
jgi:hypothetical protein